MESWQDHMYKQARCVFLYTFSHIIICNYFLPPSMLVLLVFKADPALLHLASLTSKRYNISSMRPLLPRSNPIPSQKKKNSMFVLPGIFSSSFPRRDSTSRSLFHNDQVFCHCKRRICLALHLVDGDAWCQLGERHGALFAVYLEDALS